MCIPTQQPSYQNLYYECSVLTERSTLVADDDDYSSDFGDVNVNFSLRTWRSSFVSCSLLDIYLNTRQPVQLFQTFTKWHLYARSTVPASANCLTSSSRHNHHPAAQDASLPLPINTNTHLNITLAKVHLHHRAHSLPPPLSPHLLSLRPETAVQPAQKTRRPILAH